MSARDSGATSRVATAATANAGRCTVNLTEAVGHVSAARIRRIADARVAASPDPPVAFAASPRATLAPAGERRRCVAPKADADDEEDGGKDSRFSSSVGSAMRMSTTSAAALAAASTAPGTRKLAPSPIFAPKAVHNARVSVASAVADAILAARANAPASSTPIGARAEAAIASTTHTIAAAAATTRAPRALFSTPGNSGSASNAAAIHGEKDEPPRTSESDAASAPRPRAAAMSVSGVASATNAPAASNTAPRLASAARDASRLGETFDPSALGPSSSAAAAAAAAAAMVSLRTSTSAPVFLSARYDAAAAWMDGESPSDASDAATTTPV